MMIALRRSLPALAAALVLFPAAAAAQPPGPPQPWPGTITLPRADYDRLLDLASRRPAIADADLAPVLTRAEIRARVDGALVRAALRIDGEAFRTGPAKVTLVKGATLLAAGAGSGPLPVLVEGDAHVGIFTGPGPFMAALDLGVPVTVTPGRASVILPVPPAGSATLTLDLPGEQTDVHIAPGMVLRRTSASGRTTVDVALDPGRSVQIWWSTRDSAPPAAPREVRFLTDVKTLVSIGEPDVRLLALVDVTVLQGEPARFAIDVPAGYEVTNVSGTSLERTEPTASGIAALVSDPAQRRHQFLVGLERQGATGSYTLQSGLPAVSGAQRETGLVAIEAAGTVEVTPKEVPGLRRVDVREIDPALSMTAGQLLSAYRYERTAAPPPGLVLDVKRFDDAPVLAALAERAVVTTLLTPEGRALTEVMLWVRNRAQPFAKVTLPAGASMLSVEVSGAPAKPAEGADGTRVPLLRPGFRPNGAYMVSFVYLHAGAPFAKSGDMRMTLPRMDLPISLVEWEMFVPDRYRLKDFAGDAIEAGLVEQYVGIAAVPPGSAGGVAGGILSAGPGQLVGRVTDAAGNALPGAYVVAEGAGQVRSAVADHTGAFVLSGLPSGPLTVTAQLQGFQSVRRSVLFDQRSRQVDFSLAISGVTETVTVTAEAPLVATQSAERQPAIRPAPAAPPPGEPSLNVQNLQRRASGVLPVRMDVPRTGTSYRFYRTLVVDEDTAVTFKYKRR
jgi:hypothetical protein